MMTCIATCINILLLGNYNLFRQQIFFSTFINVPHKCFIDSTKVNY